MRTGKLWKSLMAGFLAAAVVSSNLVLPVSAEPSETPAQPEEKEFRVEPQKVKEPNSESSILPLPYDAKEYGLKKGRIKQRRSSLPASYDLRKKGMSTTVKDQNPWGTCWAFGALSSLESNILHRKGGEGNQEAENPDYSEMQLGWFAFEPQTAASQIDGQAGEGLKYAGRDGRLNAGGNMFLPIALLSTWQFAANEAEVPYNTALNASVSTAKRGLSRVHLQNAYLLPDTSGYEGEETEIAIGLVKNEIMQNGAVEIAYYADMATAEGEVDAEYFNYDNWAQYVDTYMPEDHSVSVVGWDDNYPKENFNSNHQPPENGAWIVKNSWGTDSWGENQTGYFYLSYYDKSITQIVSFQGEPEGNYSYHNVYQYDYLGLSSMSALPSVDEPTSVANVFVADNAEELKAVSAVTRYMYSKVNIKIYKHKNSSTYPNRGTLVSEQTETLPYAGYHTIELKKPVDLAENESFSVVESISSEDDYGNVYYDMPYEVGLTFPVGGIYTKAVSNIGESYVIIGNQVFSKIVSDDNSMVVGNAMIKAFTTNKDPANVKRNIAKAVISAIPDQVYTGGAVTPAVTVTYKGQKLTLNKDYTAKYTNNVKAGTAIVTVTGMGAYKGTKMANFKIRTVGAPTGLKLSGQSTSAVKLSWRAASGATGYQIYRSSYKNNSYKAIATVKGGTVSYTNTKLGAGSLYKYKVRAYLTLNGKTVYSGWSNAIKAGTKIKTPALKSAKAGRKAATLKWGKVSGTTRYEVYRSTNKKSWKKVATLKSNKRSYTNKKLKSKKNYYYKVRAYKSIGGVKLYSGFSKVKKVKAK